MHVTRHQFKLKSMFKSSHVNFNRILEPSNGDCNLRKVLIGINFFRQIVVPVGR